MDDFALFRGTPIDRLLRKVALNSYVSRGIVFTTLAWLPILLILAVTGPAASIKSFLTDIIVYGRLVLAVPILIVAQQLVDARISATVKHFGESGLIATEDMPQFRRVLESISKLRDSIFPVIVLILLSYAIALLFPERGELAKLFPWRIVKDGYGDATTLAGWYYYLFSFPLYVFLVLLWFWKLIIWSAFLRRTSKLRLKLVSTHPDYAGGLGFLSISQAGFWPFVFSGGIVAATSIAQHIVFGSDQLRGYLAAIIAYLVIAPLIFFLPLLTFFGRLLRTKIDGLLRYGKLSNEYVQGFQTKWAEGQPRNSSLLGTSDIQSLADLNNSVEIVRKMRIFPTGINLIFSMFVAAALPLAPLLLFEFSLVQILQKIGKLLF